MPEELTLNDCPDCKDHRGRMQGGKSVYLTQLDRAWDIGGWWYRAICADCGKRGKAGTCGKEAAKNWNDGNYEDDPRVLTWTTEPPKVAGWYWCRDMNGETRLHNVQNFVGGPRLFVCGISKHIYPDELTGIEWAGPIPTPKENQS